VAAEAAATLNYPLLREMSGRLLEIPGAKADLWRVESAAERTLIELSRTGAALPSRRPLQGVLVEMAIAGRGLPAGQAAGWLAPGGATRAEYSVAGFRLAAESRLPPVAYEPGTPLPAQARFVTAVIDLAHQLGHLPRDAAMNGVLLVRVRELPDMTMLDSWRLARATVGSPYRLAAGWSAGGKTIWPLVAVVPCSLEGVDGDADRLRPGASGGDAGRHLAWLPPCYSYETAAAGAPAPFDPPAVSAALIAFAACRSDRDQDASEEQVRACERRALRGHQDVAALLHVP
jgi:hypothetical protein